MLVGFMFGVSIAAWFLVRILFGVVTDVEMPVLRG